MALDSNACYIGVAPKPAQDSFNRKNQYGTWSTAQAATDTYLYDWPLYDSAFSPDFVISGGSLIYVYGVTTPADTFSGLNGLTKCLFYALDRTNSPGFSMPTIATAGSGGIYSAGGTGLSLNASTQPENYLQERFLVDLLSQYYWRLYFAAQIGYKTLRECSLAVVQELPYNQELVSYRRAPTAPAVTEVKTLDGALRKITTGPASVMITATFKWSDDGTIAKNIGAILAEAKKQAKPLILYVPSNIYYQAAAIDLVYPTNEPTPIMPAPGVYELTIEGTCQP